MRLPAIAAALSAALMATAASAQVNGVDLNGRYQCARACASDAPGVFAFVTQNGWELNLVNEVGTPSRGWVNYPGRLWVDRAQVGGIYSAGWHDDPVRQRDHLAARARAAAASTACSKEVAIAAPFRTFAAVA